MKNLIIITSLFVLASCANTNVNKTELDVLLAQKDSLTTLKKEISDQLMHLELQLAELDSSREVALVTAINPTRKTFKHYFTVHGVVETNQNVILNAESMGSIDELKVKEGQNVTKGQVLAVINADLIKKNIAEVETRLDLAQTTFERQERLWKQNIGSEMQFLQAKNNRDALQNSLQTLQEQFEKTMVKAPFSGIVDAIFPKQGEMVSPGSPILRLVNLENMYLKSDVSESYAHTLKVGDSVNVSFPSLNGVKVLAQISRIGQYIDPNNRTFVVQIDLPNHENLLKPNLLAEISILDYKKDSAIVLPNQLIMQGVNNAEYVFVAQKNNGVTTAKKVAVKAGLAYNNEIVVLNGLTENDLVVSKGARSLENGQMVQVVTQ